MASSTTSLKLDADMKERVQQLAAAQSRSPLWIMREAIAQYVEHEGLRRDAVAAWEDYQMTGLHLTAEEADHGSLRSRLAGMRTRPRVHDRATRDVARRAGLIATRI